MTAKAHAPGSFVVLVHPTVHLVLDKLEGKASKKSVMPLSGLSAPDYSPVQSPSTHIWFAEWVLLNQNSSSALWDKLRCDTRSPNRTNSNLVALSRPYRPVLYTLEPPLEFQTLSLEYSACAWGRAICHLYPLLAVDTLHPKCIS